MDREHQILTIGGFLSILLIIVKQISVLYNNKQLLGHLNRSNERFQSLFDHHPDAVVSINLKGELTRVNNTAAKMANCSNEDLIGLQFDSFFEGEDLLKVRKHFHLSCQGDDQHFEVKIKKPNGKRRNLLLTNIPMYEDNQIVGIFGITKDVTDIKRNEKRINYLAYHDSLTGLANRAYFENSLDLMIAESKQDGIGFAVILIDFDRFKIINDTLGHDAGDQLLIAIAERFISLTEHKALVARQGGDEFSLLVKGTKSDVIELLDKIMTGLNKPHKIKGNIFITTASIGVSYSSNGIETAVDVLKKADIAMYASKKNGKNQYTFYEEGLAQESENQLWIENDLYHAINNKEFLLYYQPQIDSTNSRIYGVEALLRWNHPKYGILAPGQFITIAEETNMILPIGEWVLRQACLEGNKWHESGELLEIAVNISPKQFQSPHLIKMVANIIAETDFNPNYLVLEITEAVAMNNIDETVIKLKELKAMGIHISIDDFGTGHSSLSYLAQLPFDELKIPRELVNELGKETHNAIVSTIITLADNLKLKIIAEGVETNEQKSILQNMNCTNMQGYLFSKPVSREDIEHYFQQFSTN
nr:GGDEF domain-containing phosphodiesterase [Bacillus suaedae]